MDWKNISVPKTIETNNQLQDMLCAAFGILAGRSDNNTLERMFHRVDEGDWHFINDDCWWRYTDFQCHYH